MGGPLLEGEDDPVIMVNADSDSPFVLVCEHAGRRVPQSLGALGLPSSELTRHIAWDIGAEAVARRLSELLQAPLVLQRYSRLVYDCNRPPDAPDAIPMVSELTPIPGNQNLPSEAKLSRTETIYRPFHAAVAALLDGRAARGMSSILITIHSFTPVYKGVKRALDLGILHDRDHRFADILIDLFARGKDIIVKRNEPYGPADGVCHTLNLHAGVRGLLHAMIELRNDLIAHEPGWREWSDRLAKVLRQAIEAPVRSTQWKEARVGR
jgi:predicted N-formylglutamate amidohydrolase